MFNLEAGEDVKQDKDTLGGGNYIWESGIYKCTVDMAYFTEAKSGAVALNLVFVDGNNRKLKNTIYVTSGDAKGKKTYYVNSKTGEKHNLPGFTIGYNISAITLNTDLDSAAKAGQKKTLMLYDFDAGGEVAKEVDCVLVDMIGKEITVAVKKIVENKSKKGDDGSYHKIAETREINEISTVFFPDSNLTVSEKMSGVEEADFYSKWDEKWSGEVDDKTEKIGGSGASSSDSGGDVATQNKLF